LPIDNYSSQAGELFLSSPNEIQIRVVDYLDIADVLSLRICSKAFFAFLQSNAATITRIMLPRTYLGDEPMFVQCLYPQPVPIINMNYFLQILHREAVVEQIVECLVKIMVTKFYPARQYRPYHQPQAHRLQKPALVVYHYLESLQRLHLAICKDKLEYTSSTYLITLSAIVDKYPKGDIVSAFQFYRLLLLHLKQILSLDGTLRGWARQHPARDKAIARLLIFGGMGPVRKVIDSPNYPTPFDRLGDFNSQLSVRSGAASGGPEAKESEFTAIQEVVISPDKINAASLCPLPSLDKLVIDIFQDRILKEELGDEIEFTGPFQYFQRILEDSETERDETFTPNQH